MKNKIFSTAVVITLLGASYLSVTHTSVYGITNLAWLLFLLPLLGYSLATIFVKAKIDFAEMACYSVGLLIAALILIGLIINTVGLITHHATLVPKFVIPCIDFVFLTIFLWATNRKPQYFDFHIDRQRLSACLSGCLPLVLPAISILGVVQLNNGGSSLFAILGLLAIILYEWYFFSTKRQKTELAYVANIFCVTLALILSFSMRSNYILGSDINQEYQVFSAVVRNGIWQPHLFVSTYNACLSITILPAVVKSFLQLSPEYIYKFVMQMVLCFVSVAAYVIAKRQLHSKKLGFLASLFFVIQAQFMFEFPALVRQQSALLFFGLIFIAASSSGLSKTARKLLILIFGISMIVSHYSTAYVCLAFLLALILIKPLIDKFRSVHKQKDHHDQKTIQWHISGLVVLIMILFAFCWYGETLENTGGLVQKLSQSVTSFNTFFSSDSRSSFIANDLSIGSTGYDDSTLTKLEKSSKIQDSYQPKVYSQFPITPTSPNGININSEPKMIMYQFIFRVVPLIIKVIVILGAFVILIESMRGRRSIEEGVFIIGAGSLFILLVVLPITSQDYNIERLYQQLLVVIAASFVCGVQFLFARLPKLIPIVACGVILVYFACTSNLASYLTLNYADVNLINNGPVYYDKFYVQNGEADSLIWLQGHYRSAPINLDIYSALHANAFTNLPSSKFILGMLPSEISANGYVYASNSNINKDLVYVNYHNQVISYNFPLQLLNQEKNLLYDNHNSRVYK